MPWLSWNPDDAPELLVSYLYLIDLQVQLGESKLAKKSFKKHFELFNLNSTNPNDVLLALKEERKKFVKQQTIWILEEISKKIQCGVRRDAELCRLCYKKEILKIFFNFHGTNIS